MDKEAWHAAIHGVTKSQTRLSYLTELKAYLQGCSLWHYLKSCEQPNCSKPSNIFLCHPLLLLLSIFPSIRVFSNELALHIR